MKDKIMICFDKTQRKVAQQMQSVLGTLVGAAELSVTCQSFDEMDRSCFSAAIVFLFLPNLKVEANRSLVDELFDWLNSQHLYVVPLIEEEQDPSQYPVSIGKHHVLSIEDIKLHEKLLRILQEESSVFDDIKENADRIASGKLQLKDCTARQLFRWAIARMYGIGTEQKIQDALCCFRVLVGNDAFVPSNIDISIIGEGKPYIRELMDLCCELESYLKHQITDALHSRDYRDAMLFMEYSQLMQDIEYDQSKEFSNQDYLQATRTVLQYIVDNYWNYNDSSN